MFQRLFSFVVFACVGLVGFGVDCAIAANATVPTVDVTTIESAGTKILAAVAVMVAIGMGIRLFKRG